MEEKRETERDRERQRERQGERQRGRELIESARVCLRVSVLCKEREGRRGDGARAVFFREQPPRRRHKHTNHYDRRGDLDGD